MDVIPIYDSGYRGMALRIGGLNPENKTFVKHVRYPKDFMVVLNAWGYSVSALSRLKSLDCKRIMHIEKYGDEERVWVTDFENYLNKDKYTTRVDDIRCRKNQPDRRHEDCDRLYRDEQRFVNINEWRRLG